MINEYNYKKEIGARLKLYRETQKYNQKDFSSKLGIKQESLSRYESGNQSVPDEIKLKLSKENVNIDWLITGKGDMFINNSKKMNNDSDFNIFDSSDKKENEEWHGIYSKYLLEDSEPVQETIQKNINLIKVINADMKSNNVIQIPNELKNYEGKLVAVIQKGDDMEPIIKDSSIVLCDTEGYQGAGMYVIKINNIYMVKRISIKPNYYIIKSDNKLYDSFEVHIDDEQLKIGGKVRFVANVFY
ncbi:Putative phage repressor [Brachyspira pilosicoli WesB]|uniref:Putative phage repressor n=1 Tax=Brachyspira pilosicoli WesB TaxID=1161918 RepID=K0JI60_BRAPL|nr:S24 family peptidase [Brachyspira pilosicoli]CCG55781.1 Putative phage repressor [Brachyspira pilosicoli WesB]